MKTCSVYRTILNVVFGLKTSFFSVIFISLSYHSIVETLINPRMCTLIRQSDIDKCANYIEKYIQFNTNHPSLNIW